MKIGTIILLGALGFVIYKGISNDLSGDLSPDDAAKAIIAAYKAKMDADAAGDSGASLQFLEKYNQLRDKYPNAPVNKYM